MMESFSADSAWKAMTDESNGINVFMAVPTVYAKLVEASRTLFGSDEAEIARTRDILRRKFRLMVSGSAALPEVVKIPFWITRKLFTFHSLCCGLGNL